MMQNDSKEIKTEQSERVPRSYGGYTTRHEFEKKRLSRRRLPIILLNLAFLTVLGVFAAIGVLSLVRGGTAPSTEDPATGAGGIRVPLQSSGDSQITVEKALADLAVSQVTVEISVAGSSPHYGSGFVISDEGYVVCSASLVKGAPEVAVYFSDGTRALTKTVGMRESLGIALLKVEGVYEMFSISAGNSSFVERGEVLTIAGSVKKRVFYGTALSGIASTVGQTVTVTVGEKPVAVPVFFVDVKPNPTVFGAPVMEGKGKIVGFCTDAIASPYGEMAAVIPINTLYTVVNEILAD